MTTTVVRAPATSGAPARGRGGPFVGTGALLRLALRRDRILLPAWVLGFAFMVVFSVAATKDLYPTVESRVEAADAVNATAALVALYGKVYDPTSLGAVSLIKMTAFGAALMSIVFVFLVVRHTRSEEESGRLELVASGVVGRDAPLAAALLVGGIGSAALGLITSLGLIAVGLPLGGSLAFGLAWALSGLVFSAIAGVAAQLTTSHRVAIGLGMASIAVAYVLRAVGDLAATGDPGWLSWLSPIGWSQQIRPFAGDRWWVGLIPLVATLLLVPLAFALRAHRDLGSGYVADRPGPAIGRLRGVEGLAWRLQRGSLVAWLVGSVLMGAVLGSVAHNVASLLDSEQMRSYLAVLGGEQGLTDMFLAAEMTILGAVLSAYGMSAVMRLRSEETALHAELLLGTATTRLRWAASHAVIAFVGVAVLMLATGAAVGVTHGFAVGDPGEQTLRLLGAAAAHVPAAWVMAALVLLLFGFVPRWVAGAWGVLVAFVVLGEFGPLWELPQWALDLSPFAHSPTLPGGPVDALSLVLLVVTAVVVAGAGLVGWRRRDLAA
ncbi:MAG: ABC transporter permease [Candidatus Nanopelagicales bacterium]